MFRYVFFIIILLRSVIASDFDLSEMGDMGSELNNSLSAPGQNCIECEHDRPIGDDSNNIKLDSANEEIQTGYRGGNRPHIIKLTRTKNSPDQVELTIHFDQRYCAEELTRVDYQTLRLMEHRCLVHKSKKRERTFQVDFRNAPALNNDQKETYQIKLNKELDDKEIQLQFNFVEGPRNNTRVKKEESFWGLFGERYYVD